MKRIKFYYSAGYVGTDIIEIFEYPDDVSDEQIELDLAYWRDEKTRESYWQEEATEEEIEKYGIENEGQYD